MNVESSGRHRPARWAFSIVEVTLAMGVVAFAMVAVLGVLPVALTASRNSIAQTRATGLAETIFNGLRAQPFTAAVPGDGLAATGSPALPQLVLTTRGSDQANQYTEPVTLYALLTEAVTKTSSDPRSLTFTADKATFDRLRLSGTTVVSGYELILAFNKKPPGMIDVGQASAITLKVRPANGPGGQGSDTFTFVTVIARRGG